MRQTSPCLWLPSASARSHHIVRSCRRAPRASCDSNAKQGRPHPRGPLLTPGARVDEPAPTRSTTRARAPTSRALTVYEVQEVDGAVRLPWRSRPAPRRAAAQPVALFNKMTPGVGQVTITSDPATDGCPAPPFDGGGHGEPAPAAVVVAPRFTG